MCGSCSNEVRTMRRSLRPIYSPLPRKIVSRDISICWLAATALIGLVSPAQGQEIVKPREPTGTERLPAPARITAAQQPDGHIRVVWSAVEGAAKYNLARSVPPASAAAVALSNPTDTQFVDSDVKPGSTYYYIVSATGESGVQGLKLGAAPVTAGTPVVTPTTPVMISPPVAVQARSFPYDAATIDVDRGRNPPPGLRYLFERATRSGDTQSAWEAFPSRDTPCCRLVWGFQDRFPNGTRLIFRVTAYDSASPPNKSVPVLSNEITSVKITVARTEPLVADLRMIMTWDFSRHPYFIDAKLTGVAWGSLNQAVATVNGQGVATPHSLGWAYIVATGVRPDGAVQSFIWHLTVTP
jgi:hypothetical protein